MSKVLVIAPHPDDETLGCGGLISKLNQEKIDINIIVVTGAGEGKHPIFTINTWEKVRSEFKLAIKELGKTSYEFGTLPETLLKNMESRKYGAQLKQAWGDDENPDNVQKFLKIAREMEAADIRQIFQIPNSDQTILIGREEPKPFPSEKKIFQN